MSIWVDVARLAAGANVVLLAALAYIWGRNYWKFQSKHTLGLLVFSLFLLAENGLALYMYIIDPTLSGWFSTAVPIIVWRLMMMLHVLETAGLAFLTWTTLD